MSSNPNHGSEDLRQLRVPQAGSKFPFSSPISDDERSNRSFESKRTATSSDVPGSPQSSLNPFGDTESGNTSGQDEFHLERYSEPSGITKDRPPKYSKDINTELEHGRNGKRRKPDLNVVTDFSGSIRTTLADNATIIQVPVRRPELAKAHTTPATGIQLTIREMEMKERIQNSGFVNLSDLERLSKNNKRTVLPKRRKGSKKVKPKDHKTSEDRQTSQHENNAAPVNKVVNPYSREPLRSESIEPTRRRLGSIPPHLQRAKQEANGTSPTVRKVVIGISIPENEVDAHRPSDEATSALTLQTPSTPNIIVTPADATVGLPHAVLQNSRMGRPASSVYSQATGFVYRHDVDAPPVPSLPSHHKRSPISQPEHSRHSIQTWEADSPRSERPVSPDTIIDEEEARQTGDRPVSSGSRDEILPSSCDTGRPRSKGWWNLMLSPMLSRKGTNATKKTTSLTEDIPAVPCISTMTEKGLGLGEKEPMSDISPETPRRAGLQNARDSTWSIWSQWEQDREQAQVSQKSLGGADDLESDAAKHKRSDQHAQVVLEPSVKRLGLAAEYYQACAFDQVNPVPYFECVNHDCANGFPKLGDFSDRVTLSTDLYSSPNLAAAISMDKGVAETSPVGEATRLRSDSDSTIIEDDPIELSPNVRKAHARPILKAVQAQKVDSSPDDDVDEKENPERLAFKAEKPDAPAPRSATPPAYSPPPAKPKIPRYVGIMPPSREFGAASPGPLSPEAQRAIHPIGGIPMSQIQPPASTFISYNTTYPTNLPPRPGAAPVSLSDLENPMQLRQKAEARRLRLEKEDAVAHKAGGFWRGRGCIPQNGCFGRGGSAGRLRRRWYLIIASGLLLMIILIVVLATQLTRKVDQTPVQSQWLNLTGYPPMPTGISTIARPDTASAVTACVEPSSLWSCALPREDHAQNAPNDADQPNFRLEIRFRNGTVSANGTVPLPGSNMRDASASRRRALLKRQNDPFTNSLFAPSPEPPSLAEQNFLGNTTDNITSPFSGEDTPFFITFLSSHPSVPESYNDTNERSRHRARRQIGPGKIPAPTILEDGTAAPANLLPMDPLPFSQPVKLYNRGLETEHYGFYSFFDRSIFIQSTPQLNSSSSSSDGDDHDAENSNGGSPRQNADLRCTWAQTRFLVQIWTHPNFGGELLSSLNSTGSTSPSANNLEGGNSNAAASSATDFNRPGSFPYPVSISLDRHGGDSTKKGVYCYGIDGQQKIVVSEKKLVAEIRGAEGTLINGVEAVFSRTGGNKGFDGNAGGIDGGTGGCGCKWKNWAGNGGQ